ncbi:MAG TPA: metallophosphoesterase family protein [Candidatus Saccharimonadales bacterium]
MNRRSIEYVRGGVRESAKLLGASAFMGVLFSPHAINHALETTEVETTIGEFPVNLSYESEASSVDILNSGSIYLDKTHAGVGLKIKVTGLPTTATNDGIRDIISPERAAIYASLIEDPDAVIETIGDELKSATIDNVIDYLKWPTLLGGVALYGACALVREKNLSRKQTGQSELPITRGYIAGALTISLAASGALATSNHASWQTAHRTPESLTTISALTNTPFAGATTDNPQLVSLISQATEYAKLLNMRREKALAAYLEQTTPQLQEKLQSLSPPRDNEEALLIVTDFHGGTAGIELASKAVQQLKDSFGEEKFSIVLNLGDMVYDPELQRDAIKQQAGLNGDDPTVVVLGNHDIGNTGKYASEYGMSVLDGVSEIEGMRIYGKSDPQQTPFLGKPYYPNSDETQVSLGEQTYEEGLASPVDIIALHQPAAIGAVLDTNSMSEFLSSKPSSLTECNPTETIRDIPAAMIDAGHWHTNYPVMMLCNSDGTWTVLNVQGTSGGAESAPTINNWSDPGAQPQRDISFRVFYRNTIYRSITGYADIIIKPNGTVRPIGRVDIGTIDGAPFDIPSTEPKTRHKNTLGKKGQEGRPTTSKRD